MPAPNLLLMASYMTIGTCIIISNGFSKFAYARLTNSPVDREVVVGESTHFNCSTSMDDQKPKVNWYFNPAGAREDQRTYIYAFGTLYNRRFHVDIGPSGICNLVIPKATLEDAGTFDCQEDAGLGEKKSAQLVVLAETPICRSNIVTSELVGPNNCNIEPEELQLSCNVPYRGNKPPKMEWKSTRQHESLGNYVTVESSGNNATYILKMKAELHMNGVSYLCYTTRSSSAQYNCTSNTIRVKYAFSNHTTVNVSVDDRVDCSANTSDKCDYKWKRLKNGSSDLDSCNEILFPKFSGQYVCHIECNIKERSCSFPVMTAYVTEKEEIPPDSRLGTGLGSGTAVVLVVAVVVIIVITLYFRRLKNIPSKQNEKDLFVEFRLLHQEDTELGPMRNRKPIKTIETTASEKQGLAIYGLTVLDDELYLITCSCSEVEVFQSVPPFEPKRSFSSRKLSSSYDITSCKYEEHKWLYICHTVQKGNGKQKAFISRHDSEGKHLKHWKVVDRGFLSITHEQNISLTLEKRKEFIEYTSDGTIMLLVKFTLPCPIHVISCFGEKIIVCHSGGTEGSGGVSTGTVSPKDSSSSTEEHSLYSEATCCNELQSPMHMTMCNGGYILVSDPFSNRIVLLNSNLGIEKDLLTGTDGMKFPYKLHLDRSNHRLFVVDNELDRKDIISNGRVLVFDLSDPLVRFSGSYC